VPAHRSAVLWHAGLPADGRLWHAGVAISKQDSFAPLGMTGVKLILRQYARENLNRYVRGMKRGWHQAVGSA
jgi:hypothetical protein